ncbi:hypothetical protein [Rhizobium sp. BK491]|uniref:hypothetical protein n=1 Tax=Rhizobium sp. BK491 TaxID=2587009 RepID=UPI00161D72D2|nr:hypothetical protein [Rhizobium sp. BK491]MBB3571513.1 hypothetical protein [Rhizobium sp. BK491]
MTNPTTKEIKYGSVSFSLEGLKAIFSELAEIVREQGEVEISQLVKATDQSEDDFSKLKDNLRANVFHVLATVNYEDGSSIHSREPSVLKIEPNGPYIKSFYISNITPYRNNVGVEPEHMFQFFVDLRQPPLFDASRFVSSATDNETNLSIRGTRSGWRAGIEAAVNKRILRRRPVRTFFHGPFVYDLFQMIVGFPLAFYACWLSSNWISLHFARTGPVLTGAVYIYIALAAIWAYRFLFSYTKWAFPMVEISDQATRPAKHRKIWWAMITVLFGKLFWDFVGPYISISSLWQSSRPLLMP